MSEEIWKDIQGFENLYQISNQGRVKSLAKEWTAGNHNSILKHDDMIMTLKKDHPGYYYVSLHKNGKAKQCKVHRLVLQAFSPNPENKPQANHKDGVKTNNYLDNLEWSTNSENIQHAYDTGLNSNKGERNPRSKLNADIVKNIRDNKYNLNRFEFAACYGVCVSTIEKIINNKLWAHV